MHAKEEGGEWYSSRHFFPVAFFIQVMLQILCEIHRENIPKIQYIRCISIHKLSPAEAK